MNEQEIETVIDSLQTMLIGNGFGWAAEQAVQSLPSDGSRTSVAMALVQAAESVSVDLADVEIAVHGLLEVDEIDFKPDLEESQSERRDQIGDRPSKAMYLLRGPERLAVLNKLSNQKRVFQELRNQIDGDS